MTRKRKNENLRITAHHGADTRFQRETMNNIMDNKLPTRKKKTPLAQNSGKITRKTPLPPEHDLFTRLCASYLGAECVKEYRFYKQRKWRFDYAIPSHKIALEVEGGVWTQGRHVRPKGFLSDMQKYNTAALLGWRVFRTTPDRLLSNDTMLLLKSAISGSFFAEKEVF